ncbi:hypothetical protein [Alkaliphilus peptidifermentans]|nr:hypothetical protein [Alkaliphilus peptidifermentans]
MFPAYIELEFSYNCNVYNSQQIEKLCNNYVSITEEAIRAFNGEEDAN